MLGVRLGGDFIERRSQEGRLCQLAFDAHDLRIIIIIILIILIILTIFFIVIVLLVSQCMHSASCTRHSSWR